MAPWGKGIRVMKADGQWFKGWHESAEVMNGHGRWFGLGQKYYRGEFLKNECNGQGKLIYADGKWYSGTWANDNM